VEIGAFSFFNEDAEVILPLKVECTHVFKRFWLFHVVT